MLPACLCSARSKAYAPDLLVGMYSLSDLFVGVFCAAELFEAFFGAGFSSSDDSESSSKTPIQRGRIKCVLLVSYFVELSSVDSTYLLLQDTFAIACPADHRAQSQNAEAPYTLYHCEALEDTSGAISVPKIGFSSY